LIGNWSQEKYSAAVDSDAMADHAVVDAGVENAFVVVAAV
jgi:hypothetical protein